jgi:carbamoylphosphate synthase large subunit
MPRRNDIHRILLLGSGPIRIGQAAEFDFSGSQACRALREDGFEVILVNSNPATIQNDPEMADVVYIEPLLPDVVRKIIETEKPDALLAGMGGQTALNIATELANDGTLEKHGVELIGSDLDAIEKAEDRALFKDICESIDLPVPKAIACNSIDEVILAAELQAIAFGTGKSIDSHISLNNALSSAFSIASKSDPINSTPCFSRVPSFANSVAIFNAVCPPIPASKASGFSVSIILRTTSGSKGSMYTTSAISGSF